MQALPKLAKTVTNPNLQKAIEGHLEETKKQVERVEKSFEETGKTARAKTCKAMQGLVEETQEVIKEEAEPAVKDALLIACAQKVEHYEIATYGTLCTWAEELGYSKALKLLKQNIKEEEAADEKLSKLAKTVNSDAMVDD